MCLLRGGPALSNVGTCKWENSTSRRIAVRRISRVGVRDSTVGSAVAMSPVTPRWELTKPGLPLAQLLLERCALKENVTELQQRFRGHGARREAVRRAACAMAVWQIQVEPDSRPALACLDATGAASSAPGREGCRGERRIRTCDWVATDTSRLDFPGSLRGQLVQ